MVKLRRCIQSLILLSLCSLLSLDVFALDFGNEYIYKQTIGVSTPDTLSADDISVCEVVVRHVHYSIDNIVLVDQTNYTRINPIYYSPYSTIESLRDIIALTTSTSLPESYDRQLDFRWCMVDA